MAYITPQHPKIYGLSIDEGFITTEEEIKLCNIIDAQPWDTQLKRRIQQYGYKYNHLNKVITKTDFLGELPDWLQTMAQKIQKVTGESPNQVIINEYLKGQGIKLHVDNTSCFGAIITSVSLLVPGIMLLENLEKTHLAKIRLPNRSSATFQKEARYNWKHSILPLEAERRISITFRLAIPT